MKYILAEGCSNIGESWNGAPVSCDICGTESPDCFVQGRIEKTPATQFFPTVAEMCLPCFKLHGQGIGKGLGNKYCKQQ